MCDPDRKELKCLRTSLWEVIADLDKRERGGLVGRLKDDESEQ